MGKTAKVPDEDVEYVPANARGQIRRSFNPQSAAVITLRPTPTLDVSASAEVTPVTGISYIINVQRVCGEAHGPVSSERGLARAFQADRSKHALKFGNQLGRVRGNILE